MVDTQVLSGNTEEELWQQVNKYFTNQDSFQHRLVLEQQGRQVLLHVDIDLGGGFEGGFEFTTLTAVIDNPDAFRFGINKQGFLDEIGKFFGMQDVIIGFPEFDKNVIVKTNDEEKVKQIFSNEDLRQFFESIDENFSFGITTIDDKEVLEFTIEKGIVSPESLRHVYHHFRSVLVQLDAPVNNTTSVY